CLWGCPFSKIDLCRISKCKFVHDKFLLLLSFLSGINLPPLLSFSAALFAVFPVKQDLFLLYTEIVSTGCNNRSRGFLQFLNFFLLFLFLHTVSQENAAQAALLTLRPRPPS